MFAESKASEMIAGEAMGEVGYAVSRMDREMCICLVAQSKMRVTKIAQGGGVSHAWSESSAKTRDLKPVAELVEQLLLQVLEVAKKHLTAQVGQYEKAGVYHPMAIFTVDAVEMSSERRRRAQDLMAAVPALLMNGARLAVPMSWMSPGDLEKVEEAAEAILVACKGRTIPADAAIDIMVDGTAVGTIRTKFAAASGRGKLTPVREQFVGYVVGFSTKKGLIEFEEISGRSREIRAKVGSLDVNKLSHLMQNKAVAMADVETTTLPTGKLNHELVNI